MREEMAPSHVMDAALRNEMALTTVDVMATERESEVAAEVAAEGNATIAVDRGVQVESETEQMIESGGIEAAAETEKIGVVEAAAVVATENAIAGIAANALGVTAAAAEALRAAAVPAAVGAAAAGIGDESASRAVKSETALVHLRLPALDRQLVHRRLQ